MRREKLRIAASLGRSGTHRTSSTAPFLTRSFLALLAFDDANGYLKVHPIRQCFTPAHSCESAGRHTVLAKVVSFGCIHYKFQKSTNRY